MGTPECPPNQGSGTVVRGRWDARGEALGRVQSAVMPQPPRPSCGDSPSPLVLVAVSQGHVELLRCAPPRWAGGRRLSPSSQKVAVSPRRQEEEDCVPKLAESSLVPKQAEGDPVPKELEDAHVPEQQK